MKRLFLRYVPAGYRNTDGSFNNRTNNTNIWSSVESGGNAWKRNLNYTEARVNRNTNNKANGFSVRCLKDWLNIYMPTDKLLIDLFQAYYDARKNKRSTINALAFEINYETKLFELYEEIKMGYIK